MKAVLIVQPHAAKTRKVKISERIDLTEVMSPSPLTIGLSSAPLSPIIKADSG
jgi:hypothetical protein